MNSRYDFAAVVATTLPSAVFVLHVVSLQDTLCLKGVSPYQHLQEHLPATINQAWVGSWAG